MTSVASIYEKLGVFYLGRSYDLKSKSLGYQPLLYDSKDLVTHAVIVGMTGSGKTGLGITLLEEAAMDGIPALVIDPKGDLTNLLLTFPNLRPEDFAPWINADDARRNGQTPHQFATAQAKLWRDGLAQWDQDGQRIGRLQAAADFCIYTPGSDAGQPVSILSSFAPPAPQLAADGDLMRDHIGTTATSLLALLGIEADPIRSREHILLTTLIDDAWRKGMSLDLGALIHLVQNPPVGRIGVLDLESFYPSKERFELALALNNLLASPGFSVWLTGTPLDVNHLLYTPQGKPRISIFYIAHLADTERMFFMSLLLNQILGWMRSRTGTTSLRALLYIDEIFGYMPPISQPPTKKPLLTLLKQARAYGLGVVLATQNPVDLDYKGLSNTGTWFLGRLQTERDKLRVLDGLEDASIQSGSAFDRGAISSTLAALGKRVFLMHNVHDPEPVTFQTRWAMSYLAGPMTRTQIKRLTDSANTARSAAETGYAPAAAPADAAAQGGHAGWPSPDAPSPAAERPVLQPDVPQVFLPVKRTPAESRVFYQPRLIGMATVHFVDNRKGILTHETIALLAPLDDGATAAANWDNGADVALTDDDLLGEPPEPGSFGDIPATAGQAKWYSVWKKALQDHLYRTRRVYLLRSNNLNQISAPGESERDFRVRLADHAREERDMYVEKLRKQFASRIGVLQERIRKAELRLGREEQQAQSAKLQTAISFGAAILSVMVGRKKLSSTSVGRATAAARGADRAARQADDVRRAKEELRAYQEQWQDLQSELEAEIDKLSARYDPLNERFDTYTLKPRKSDIDVRHVALAWVPFGKDAADTLVPLYP